MQPKRPAARLRQLCKLFLSYRGTENERPLRHEQATLLFGMKCSFAILGLASCTLLSFAFTQHKAPRTVMADSVIILLYLVLVASGVRWRRQGNDVAYIRVSVWPLSGPGVAWGALVDLFALWAVSGAGPFAECRRRSNRPG